MLTITVDDRAFREHLDALQRRLGDLSEPLAAIGGILENRVRQRFETKTDPRGRPWAPWAKSTAEGYPYPGSAAAKADGAGQGQLLIRYGDMLDHLSWQADANSVTLGFKEHYAVFHEWGAPARNMPRRGLLFDDPDAGTLAPDDEKAVLTLLEDWLAG